MRALSISVISFVMTIFVISNAVYQKKQFYPSVVYITKSNASMAVIYLQSLVLVLMLGKLMRKIFLGTLRAAEFEHLMERFWYALTETCLAFTVFRDDFNPKFVALFTILLFLKCFHWLAEDRVDYMERSPVIGCLFHIRVSALLTVLGLLDYMMISHAYYSTISKGPTVQLVFGFEYAILFTMVANITIKYVLHAAEMRADSPWENKAVFLLYTELVIGFIRVVLYILFVVIMVRIYTLPLFAFRPMYYTMRNFKKALNDVILSRRAIRNMNTLYPDATPEELSTSDNICIICREDMVNNSKKLPCGHIFHTSCLRSWFQRQQTCPTCRLNILRTTTPTPNAPAPGAQPNIEQPNVAAGAAAVDPVNLNNIPPGVQNIFGNLMPTIQNIPNMGGVENGHGNFTFPPMFPAYNLLPPPPIPPLLDSLTDEEVRLLEGNERRHVEERIKLLRNIQLLLDASVTLMNQYSTIMARVPEIPIQNLSSGLGPATMEDSVQPQQENIPPPATNIPANDSSQSTSAMPEASTSAEQPSTSKGLSSPAKSDDLVKIEDLGSEEHVDMVNSSMQQSNSSDETNEIRRRRLNKFLKPEETTN